MSVHIVTPGVAVESNIMFQFSMSQIDSFSGAVNFAVYIFGFDVSNVLLN